jgi:N-acetylglutamate synthase-like GNAT family acetyltransferase
MNNVSIQPFQNEEYNELAKVFLISFKGSVSDPISMKNTTQKFKIFGENNVTHFFIAKNSERIVGMGGVTYYKGSSFIGYLGVLPKYRNQGIGTKLFIKLFQAAKKENPIIELFANLDAVSIYRRFGFKEEFFCNRYELHPNKKSYGKNINQLKEIPSWIFDLDKKIMGYDRFKLLNCLFSKLKFSLISYSTDGYLFYDDENIGPIVAKNSKIAIELTNYVLRETKHYALIPSHIISDFSKFTPEKVHETKKMIYENQTDRNLKPEVMGYYSYATG